MAMQRQEEKGAVQDRAPPKHRREERMEPPEPEESHSSQRNRNPKTPNKPPGEEIKYDFGADSSEQVTHYTTLVLIHSENNEEP